jgi:hypothetical protein
VTGDGRGRRGRIDLRTLLLCDYALTAQDGKISAVGIFSQINVARLPAVHGRCYIVAMLEAEPGAHEVTFGLVAPSGRNTLERPPRLRIEVPATATTANILAELRGLRVEEVGRHRLEVSSGGRVLGSTPFLVNLRLTSQRPATA